MKKGLFSLILLAINILPISADVNERTIHEGWRFRQGSSECWHSATVPGTVHTDLMSHGLIDDPFYRFNERSVQWIDKEDWMYETRFTPTAEELAASSQTLVFNGLDTYADVYLNHQLLVSVDNMHRTWRCNVKGILKEGENLLEVYFKSPIRRNIPKWDALPYQHNTGPDHSWIGGVFNKTVSIFARTAGYEYGWDWGPRMVTFGIWRPVVLQTWTEAHLADTYHKQNDVTAKRARLTTIVEVDADSDIAGATLTVTADGKKVATKKCNLTKGHNKISVDYTINNPRLWWTHQLGEQYLYEFETTLAANGKVLDSSKLDIGLRSIKVISEDDEHGRCFYFMLNGQPLFAKGSNMVPNDNFLPRVTDSIYRQVVLDAKAVNMNMIRVWGGGIYEDDAFYRHCDEQGILIWQDFAFACGTWPADSAFLASVREEAIDNVKRIRNHAALAILIGNNESQDVWWGWGNKKKQLDEMGYGDEVWEMQYNLFYRTLPDVVKEYAPNVTYRPSSPWWKDDQPSDGRYGDDHYWGVWHGAEPFDAYYDHHVRFESEYGFQSFPEYESILKYAPYEVDHNIYSDAMMIHQKAGTYANHRIEEYMKRDYRMPSDFKTFVYVGQVMQGDGVKMGMEAFRRDRPYCMGSLVWQLNDCWPVASWSSRDYYGRWKALHYFTKYAYDDILVAPRVYDPNAAKPDPNRQVAALPSASNSTTRHIDQKRSDNQVLEIKLVSDRLKKAKGTFTLTTMTLDGRTVYTEKSALTMPANTAILVMTRDVNDILGGEKPENVIFHMTYTTGDKTYSNIAYAARQKDMNYTRPNITTSVVPAGDGYDVTLTTDIFARGVFMAIKGIDNFFADNYFDMLPGTQRTIHVRSTKPLDQFKSELEVVTLGDIY